MRVGRNWGFGSRDLVVNDWFLLQDTPTPCFDQSTQNDDCVQEDLYDDVIYHHDNTTNCNGDQSSDGWVGVCVYMYM